MGGNVAENLSNQSVPEAAARVAAVVNRLVNRIGSNAESRERLAEIEIPEELRDNLALFLRLERRVLSEYDPEVADPVRQDFDSRDCGQCRQPRYLRCRRSRRRAGRAHRRRAHCRGIS